MIVISTHEETRFLAYAPGFQFICNDCPMIDLTIRLGGQSKHISHVWSCDVLGQSRAATAICDLEDKIRKIVDSAPGIRPPTATPPSPTATAIPTPTGTPPASMRSGDFGILSRQPCGPPCFRGIWPGVTTFADAAVLLGGMPCSTSDTPQGKTLNCSSGDVAMTVATSGLCAADAGAVVVMGIGLAPPNKIALGDFVAQYGPPDSLMLSGASEVILPYANVQSAVVVRAQREQQGSFTVRPATVIAQVIYVTAADLLKCSETMNRDQQPWTGFGTYSPVRGQ